MADMCDTCGDGVVDLLKKILESERDSFTRLGQLTAGGGVSEDVNISGVGGVATSTGCGIATAGTLRVAQATDCVVTTSNNNGAGAAAVNIQDGGNSITVDGTVSSSTTSVVPGTGATNLGKAEDSASVSGDTGVLSLFVRNDTNATLTSTDLDYGAPTVDLAGNTRVVGNLAHDAVDSGNPVKTGAVAIAHGTNPTAVAAGDRTNLYANRAGVPFVIGGHPNIITIRANSAAAQTDVAVVTVGAGAKIVVTAASIVVANSNTVDVSAILGFGAATTPTTTGVVASHPGIAPGSGYARGDGSGILGIGADGEDLRITNSVPTGGLMTVLVSYYTVES